MRHTAAHLLAHAVVDLYGPEVKLAIGPAIDNGFYYDFLKSTPFVPEDLPRIEERMRELITQCMPLAATRRTAPLVVETASRAHAALETDAAADQPALQDASPRP